MELSYLQIATPFCLGPSWDVVLMTLRRFSETAKFVGAGDCLLYWMGLGLAALLQSVRLDIELVRDLGHRMSSIQSTSSGWMWADKNQGG